ncbi:MAG: filamentation induced by cAMP protein Fic [Thermoleophilia bacterium]|nr:filamentation induced by cAMP protein Fic [Thermoleophilia bacterium]
MAAGISHLFPDGVEVAASSAKSSSAFAELVRRGDAVRIARGIYARAGHGELSDVVRRNRYRLLSLIAPGAVITDRTAFQADHTVDGTLFASVDAPARDIALPGLLIRLRRGAPAIDSDQLLPLGSPPIAIASAARAVLENTAPSRARSGPSRTLSPEELEEQLVTWAQTRGTEFVRETIDAAAQLAETAAFASLADGVPRLREIASAIEGSTTSGARTKALRAMGSGVPFDVGRTRRFQALLDALDRHEHAPRTPRGEDGVALPFFESYFSNFIEGTEFAVEEAERIVFEGALPAGRTADAHDVRCTYTLTHDLDEMRLTPKSGGSLIDILTTRHRVFMASRPDKRPGKFKLENNQAGASTFVHPDLVRGTLLRGYEMSLQIHGAFQRAAFLMFLVSEVHPFDDGNGRIARMMMNAELVAGSEQRILVPVSARGMYLGALRRLTRDGEPGQLIDSMELLQHQAHGIDWASVASAHQSLAAIGAFEDPDIAPNNWRLL